MKHSTIALSFLMWNCFFFQPCKDCVYNADLWACMNGYADEPWRIVLGHYKTILPCWKLQFVWLSQQKEPDWHPQPLSLWSSVPQHNSTPVTRSKISNGQWGSSDVDIQPDSLPCWMGAATGWGSNSLSVPGLPHDLPTFNWQFFLGVISTSSAVCWCWRMSTEKHCLSQLVFD